MASPAEIGVIVDSPLQRHVLQRVLSSYGLSVHLSCEPQNFEHQPAERIAEVDCWLVDIADEALEEPIIEALFDLDNKPVLFGLGQAPEKHDELYISWERRLIGKLQEHLGQIEQLESEESILALDASGSNMTLAHDDTAHATASRSAPARPAKEVWILAASLGGPAAVKEFLDLIPADIEVGFLYAQHVDPHFSKVLTQVLSRHSELNLRPLEHGHTVAAGEVLMVPVDREVRFGPNGAQLGNAPWPGPYGPSIDQLFANALAHYGSRCHAIVFSGMGNDGALSAPRMRKAGCTIWTQTPETCANSSMPESIIDLQSSDFTAAPADLAQALIERYSPQSSRELSKASAATEPDRPVGNGDAVSD